MEGVKKGSQRWTAKEQGAGVTLLSIYDFLVQGTCKPHQVIPTHTHTHKHIHTNS
jgi:hypothetical protein